MASGPSGRANTGGSKGFDFASDDILCSYEDYGTTNQVENGSHSDSGIGSNITKDFHQTRISRLPTSTYRQPDDSYDQDITSVFERITKKHSENVLRFLEGLSSRLSQLELYCYNLDKSIGEMRVDLVRDHEEGDSKLKAIEKHLQEVHRSVQLLRDKQELAETQNELAKLQLAQKESSSSPSHSNEERQSPFAADSRKVDNTSDMHNNQQLALLPQHVTPPPPPPQQQQPVGPPPVQNVNQQQQPYYLSPSQMPSNQPAVAHQHAQAQYQPSDAQYRTPQVQESARMAPQPQVNQNPPGQQFAHYQQQWQQVPPPQQGQMRPMLQNYPSYPPSQPTNPSPSEQLPNSMPMQMQFSGVPQPMPSRADTMPYGYGAPGRTAVPQQPPPKANYGTQQGEGYPPPGSHPNLPPGSAYMIYDSESGRVQMPPQPHMAPQGGGYPPPATTGAVARNPSHSQFARNQPYGELIEKMMSMGFRGEHVVGVIQRMEESGQPVDFNTVLDRLNVHSGGSPQRGWSG